MKQEARVRITRRILGFLSARLAELPLDEVRSRRKRNRKWPCRTLLTALIVGLVAGCKGLREVERLLANELGEGARKLLGLWRRVADTTLRDYIMALKPDAVRALIYQQILLADRRKQLTTDMPIRAVSMDGKATSTRLFDPPEAEIAYAQRQGSIAVVRTITSCLVTAPGRPCIDAHPVPPATNEMGAFIDALDALLTVYARRLFDLVMYDSGACSLANATAIFERGLDYLMCLTALQPELLREAQRVLGKRGAETALAETVELEGSKVVVRRLWLTEDIAGWLDWTHLRTVARVQYERTDKLTGQTTIEDCYYITSMPASRLVPADWLKLIRRRWAVENDNHKTLDTVFDEDDRPWLIAPQGMLVMMLLRRLE